MPENLMNSSHKATNQQYRDEYERIFRCSFHASKNRHFNMIPAPNTENWSDEEKLDTGPFKGCAVEG